MIMSMPLPHSKKKTLERPLQKTAHLAKVPHPAFNLESILSPSQPSSAEPNRTKPNRALWAEA